MPPSGAPVGPSAPTGKKSNRWGILVIALVAVGSIAAALLADGPEKIAASLLGADRRWLAAGAGCMLLYWVLESACLHLAARRAWPAQRLGDSVVTSMIGQLFNCITPFASGGQPIQAFYMTRGGMPVGKASSVLLAKFIVYQTVLALYSAGVLVFAYRSFVGQVEGFTQLALIGFAVNAAVVVVLFCVGFFPKITGGFFRSCLVILARLRIVREPERVAAGIDREIAAFHQGFTELRREHRVMAAMTVMTTLQLTAFFLVPYCVLRALGVLDSAGDYGGGLRRLYPDDLLLCAAAGCLRRGRGQLLYVLPDVLQGIGECERCHTALAAVHLLSAHCGGGLFCPASFQHEGAVAHGGRPAPKILQDETLCSRIFNSARWNTANLSTRALFSTFPAAEWG